MATEDTPLWRVTGQIEAVDVAPTGGYASGVRVSYQTRSGANGSIFVPAADYRAEVVRARLDEAAANAEAIHTMTAG